MKTKILLTVLLFVAVAACKKDKYNTAPTLTLKSISDKVIPRGGGLNITFELTDKEGDISDTLYFKKVRTNVRVFPLLRDSLAFAIPQVIDTRTVLLDLKLDYNNHLVATAGGQTDSLTLQVWVKDKANNKSEIFNIENVVVLK